MAVNKTLGASLLIAGCSIGAGMLALPILSLSSGFFPALAMLVAACLYMVCTGWLLTEVLFKTNPNHNLLTLADRLFGAPMKLAVGLVYGFLFFSLLTAYLSASGSLFNEWLGVSANGSSLCLALFFLAILFTGITGVDLSNRVLFFGLIITYFLLLITAFPHIDPSKWLVWNFKASFIAFPAMVISFGYHNLIPTLAKYLDGDKQKVLRSILYGNALTFLVYVLWQASLLGILESGNGTEEFVTEALARATEASWIIQAMRLFSLFAIATSFIAIAASFVDFLFDATKRGKNLLKALVVGLPLALALISPGVFYKALHYGGGIGAVFVFGLFPSLAAWKIGEKTPLAITIASLSLCIFFLTLATL